DLSREQQTQVPSLRVEYDRAAIARHGLRVADVSRALELVTSGAVVGQVLEGMNSFDLVLRSGAVQDLTADAISEALVDTPSGGKLPLKALATFREDTSPNFISRENVQRRIVVTCNVAGRDIHGVVEEIRRDLEESVPLPEGYHVEYGGKFESAEATGRLLALLGGIVGVHLAGGVLSVASIIGFITVFGVAARNGIMLVSHIRHLQIAEGVADFRQAVRQGAMERLAPIFMTALAAGLALVPLALRGERPGNEILTPMAIVILFGLLSSTFLNVIVVPALYLQFGRPVRREQGSAIELGADHA